jgi:hypothetical protein
MQHLLTPASVKQLLPRARLRPFLPSTPQQLATDSQLASSAATRSATCHNK